MTIRIGELESPPVDEPQGGVGALQTQHGNLPLRAMSFDTDVLAMSARTVMTQEFHNPYDDPIEATYIFPLPQRAATTDMVFTAGERTVTAQLKERGQARREYDEAVSHGKRAAIAESERDDVFTMRVGNILPGESATVKLTFVGPLALDGNEATLRLPLVVAPRFIPGAVLDGAPVGAGYAPDTDVVADASRITPPVLLPGFPNPIDLSISVNVDASGLGLHDVRASLHTLVTDETADGRLLLRIHPAERVNRDFILRLTYGSDNAIDHSFIAVAADKPGEGTFALTVLPPETVGEPRARDVVVLVDRSGSMKGWKMVAARRFAARIIDTLSDRDRFAVRCFDSEVTSPTALDSGLNAATDANRFAAVEFLANTQARGGTRMLGPLSEAATIMDGGRGDRDRTIVVITDGQVGNEDQILGELHGRVGATRIHTIGIDTAVNASFLHRLALLGRGRCELVESAERLDEAAARIHRRIATPVVTDVTITAHGATIESVTPSPVTDLFAEAPLRVWGRYAGADDAMRLTVAGTDADGEPWRVSLAAKSSADPLVPTSWARSRLGDLTDRYAAADKARLHDLEKQIVDVSLQYGVLSRFTAFVAVNSEVVVEDGRPRTVVQPVEMPQGWQMEPPGQPQVAVSGAATLMAMPASMDSGRARRGASRTGHFGMKPTTRVARGRAPKPRAMEELHAIIAAELQVLNDVSPDERARRSALSDLAARLRIVVEQRWDAANETLAALRQLVDVLAQCDEPAPPRGDKLESLWDRASSVLTALSQHRAADRENDDVRPRVHDDVPFWKRGQT